MAASAEQLETLRRMIAEPTEDTYTDKTLGDLLSTYGTLKAVAAQVWQEKASAWAANFDFATKLGGSYQRQQQYEHAVRMAQFYGSRRGVRTITQVPSPQPPDRDVEVVRVEELRPGPNAGDGSEYVTV